jgi:hypothetical protein
LLLHQGGEIYVDEADMVPRTSGKGFPAEPQVEVFPFDDPYAREVEHLSGAIRGEHALAWGLDDARANTAVLEAMHESLRLGALARVAS